MSQYVDGFLLPLAADRLEEYKRLATKAGEVWMEHGALAYWETIEDDLSGEEMRSFRVCADARENEIVIFAWVVYASREDRDRILAAVMEDPRLRENAEMPFDMKRMAHGGFKPIVAINS
ncbi:DUF1428 domain-containing protein [Cellvibrio sp.]|uniref:DUF1428 domain-containing protein n=1 Tax=Cellvibrio sp. TaxID=1965322 RepID=UPI00396488D8